MKATSGIAMWQAANQRQITPRRTAKLPRRNDAGWIAGIIMLALMIAAGAIALRAQTAAAPAPIEGQWSGIIANQLHIVLTIRKSGDGGYSAIFDSVDQGAQIPVQDFTLNGDKVQFEIKLAGGMYQGTVSKDGKTIAGMWAQTGAPEIPLNFTWTGAAPAVAPAPVAVTRPPVALADLQAVMDKDMAAVLDHGVMKSGTGGGLVIGVLDHGQRRIFAYGTAKPDSIFEIGSITKTFTGLILAQMVVQKKVSFDEPVRMLLPNGVAAKPDGKEITLLDLATQHSGLPRLPDNLHAASLADPYADYGPTQLYDFLAHHGVALPDKTDFLYSNLGYGLLGDALAVRTGVPYEELVRNEVTGPLHLDDTVVTLSPAQTPRLIQGYLVTNQAQGRWHMGALEGAGALTSTAADMLTYLDANLHPEKYGAAGAAAGSPAATLPAAFALDHEIRADAMGPFKIALAWLCTPADMACFHDGGTGGYTAFVNFLPKDDRAVVVLYNRDDIGASATPFADQVAGRVILLLEGKPSVPLDQ
jgi:serine-type D-Ala-D-Ala carboxypeptidase/endopeptidase